MRDPSHQQKSPPSAEQKGPFSPLQSGCAFVMLTNMLIYLALVLFVFNLLDPSRLDASYLSKRRFTAEEEPEPEEDRTFREKAEERREANLDMQSKTIEATRSATKKTSSAAGELSRLPERELASSAPLEPERLQAARTEGSIRGGIRRINTPNTRRYNITMFPRNMPRRNPFAAVAEAVKTIQPEAYSSIPVEIAPGLPFPFITLPGVSSADSLLYNPPNTVPSGVRGGRPLTTAPAGGGSTYYTNYLRDAAQPAGPDSAALENGGRTEAEKAGL